MASGLSSSSDGVEAVDGIEETDYIYRVLDPDTNIMWDRRAPVRDKINDILNRASRGDFDWQERPTTNKQERPQSFAFAELMQTGNSGDRRWALQRLGDLGFECGIDTLAADGAEELIDQILAAPDTALRTFAAAAGQAALKLLGGLSAAAGDLCKTSSLIKFENMYEARIVPGICSLVDDYCETDSTIYLAPTSYIGDLALIFSVSRFLALPASVRYPVVDVFKKVITKRNDPASIAAAFDFIYFVAKQADDPQHRYIVESGTIRAMGMSVLSSGDGAVGFKFLDILGKIAAGKPKSFTGLVLMSLQEPFGIVGAQLQLAAVHRWQTALGRATQLQGLMKASQQQSATSLSNAEIKMKAAHTAELLPLQQKVEAQGNSALGSVTFKMGPASDDNFGKLYRLNNNFQASQSQCNDFTYTRPDAHAEDITRTVQELLRQIGVQNVSLTITVPFLDKEGMGVISKLRSIIPEVPLSAAAAAAGGIAAEGTNFAAPEVDIGEALAKHDALVPQLHPVVAADVGGDAPSAGVATATAASRGKGGRASSSKAQLQNLVTEGVGSTSELTPRKPKAPQRYGFDT